MSIDDLPEKVYYTWDLQKMIAIPLKDLQELARILHVKKDSCHVYNFNKQQVKKIANFIQEVV